MSNFIKSPFKHPFWSAFCGIGPQMKALDEWLIINASYAIRSKDNWARKYKDSVISEKWKKEIEDAMIDKTSHVKEIIEYVWEELRWYETLYDQNIYPVFHEMIVTNEIKNQKLKDSLKQQSLILRDSFKELDYHPNSGNTVVDLVHPSLFPIQYGKTVITKNQEPQIITFADSIVAKKGVEDYGISKNYQWIPSLLNFDNKFVFDSYINNLNPLEYSDLYSSIEDVFNAVIPDLNYVLSRYASSEYIRVPISKFDEAYREGYSEKLDELEQWLEDSIEKGSDDDYYTKFDEKLYELKKEYIKEFPPKYECAPPNDVPIDVREYENLKVIVKMANIELTPQNPKYNGGTWHVEGTINEDIIATILYYYDVENITESKIEFRASYEDPEYEQGDTLYCEYFYGLKDEDSMAKNLGSLETKEDRVIIFPNFFQHRVDSFQLKDGSIPGHRKILCFFIVDPNNDKVLSTKEVPPQQKDWWSKKELIEYLIPNKDLREKIRDVINTQDLEEAKRIRENLMKERVSAVQEIDEMASYERQFSLCEH